LRKYEFGKVRDVGPLVNGTSIEKDRDFAVDDANNEMKGD